MIQEYIERTQNEELTSDDIYAKLAGSEAFCIAFAAHRPNSVPDIDVKLVLVLEVVRYPRLNAMNIVVLAGEDLLLFSEKFWGPIKNWAYINGVRAIEALTSPAVERLIKNLGFKRKAVLIRTDLGD